MPFTAPRGFGIFLRHNPNTPIEEYLEITRPPVYSDFFQYARWLRSLSSHPLLLATYRYPLAGVDLATFAEEARKPIGREAFLTFKEAYGASFKFMYGREMTVVDYIRLTGRRHVDGILNFHIHNGADFVYADGRITGIFPNSRPEDPTCAGYNIVMTYMYHPLLF